MTTVINTPTLPPAPVLVDFWWNAEGPPFTYTIGGLTFPYHHQEDEDRDEDEPRPSDYRYETWTTIANTEINFDANDVKEEGHPKIVTPPGVRIIEYRWNLGDGTIAFGPQVTHTYTVTDVNDFVTLIVTDSRGLRWSSLKPLNLISLASRGIVAAYKIRV